MTSIEAPNRMSMSEILTAAQDDYPELKEQQGVSDMPLIFATGPEQEVEILSIYPDDEGNLCIDLGDDEGNLCIDLV